MDLSSILITAGGFAFILLIGVAIVISQFYRKPGPEEAIVRTGMGDLSVMTGKGMVVFPLIQSGQVMDLSVKRIEIAREGEDGLICQDNIRADIRVAFYVRVNNNIEDIKSVAEMINPERVAHLDQLRDLFEAKFSEALKTVGKHFDFVTLYTDREKFRDRIQQEIGTDLNGYRLDNCHVDYLEQTPIEKLNPQNILDAEGIKKITELTTQQNIQRNHFEVEEAKTIKKQDVERDETLYELERQRVDAQEKQKREIAEITARNAAEAAKVQQEERLRSETARLVTEEEVGVRDEAKQRQIIVAEKAKDRALKVETERVEKDRQLEATERQRVVALATIEKDKAIETEKRTIQEIIRERVVVERATVEQQEEIENTKQFMGADRSKRVAVTAAEQEAQQALVEQVTAAEAAKQAAEYAASQRIIAAEAERAAAEKEMQSKKMLAEGRTAEHAAVGLAEAEVITAKAGAKEMDGTAEAVVIERTAVAAAKGEEARAIATEKLGTAEATVMQLKFGSEATGIEQKANAMKLFNEAGKEHEEFKLRLKKDLDIETAAIDAQTSIASSHAEIVGEALKSARIDIVGGESTFFDKVVESVKGGKVIDRLVYNSGVLSDVQHTFFNGNPEYFQNKLREFTGQFHMSFDDIKDLSIAALIGKMLTLADNDERRSDLQRLLDMAKGAGLAGSKFSALAQGATATTSG